MIAERLTLLRNEMAKRNIAIYIVPTDEELMIAMDTMTLIK